jgi:glyoxylase-like metal-dependent hydrolase (beta-lactamase superfamily II)
MLTILRCTLFVSALETHRRGHAPEDVDIVIITHCHMDHIGGLMTGGKLQFPNAGYVFGAAEFDFWMRGNVRDERKFNLHLFEEFAAPLADRATFIKPGEQIVSGICAVDTSGHSPGMMVYMIESQGEQMLNWADTCGHYVVSLQRPDLHVAVDDDKEKAVITRKRILDLVATDRILVAG